MLAVLLSGIGARDQATVAALSRHQRKRPAVLIVSAVLATGTASLAVWAAMLISAEMQMPARLFLCVIALGFAAGELLLIMPRQLPAEPTHSLGAISLVLVVQQITSAPRFIIFGIAAAANAPVSAALGGALGGAALLAFGWVRPKALLDMRISTARRVIGAGVLLAAVYGAMRVANGM